MAWRKSRRRSEWLRRGLPYRPAVSAKRCISANRIDWLWRDHAEPPAGIQGGGVSRGGVVRRQRGAGTAAAGGVLSGGERLRRLSRRSARDDIEVVDVATHPTGARADRGGGATGKEARAESKAVRAGPGRRGAAGGPGRSAGRAAGGQSEWRWAPRLFLRCGRRFGRG